MAALARPAARPDWLLWQRILRELRVRRGGAPAWPAFRPDWPVPPAGRPVLVAAAGPGAGQGPGAGGVAPGLRELYRLRAGDPAAADAFVQYFWPNLEREAAHYARRGGDYDDLLGEGALGLWEAALGYDPRRHRTRVPDYVTGAVHRRVRRAYRRQMGFDRPAPFRQAGGLPAGLPAAVDPAAVGPAAVDPAAVDPAERVAARLDLAAALARLEPAQQAELGCWLRAVAGEGLGPEAAVRSLAGPGPGRGAAAVKKRLQRARRRVAGWLAEDNN